MVGEDACQSCRVVDLRLQYDLYMIGERFPQKRVRPQMPIHCND